MKKLTAKDVIKALNLKDIDSMKELKIQKILNTIYSKANPPEEKVLNVVLNIYLVDSSLSAIDDIYFISYGPQHIDIEFKYSFWPKKLTELGVFKVVDAYVVREGEEFTIEIDNGKTYIKHKQNPFATNKPIIGAYARGIKEDGSVIVATANLEELKAASQASKVKSKGKKTIWDVWFEEVSKKVPLKRLVKLISVPSELQQAIDIDSKNYASIQEIEQQEKNDDAIVAMEELNNVKSKPTIAEYLQQNDVKFELKNGYIKIEKDIVNKMLHKDELFRHLIGFKKDPRYLIGKANTQLDIEEEPVEEIEYVSE